MNIIISKNADGTLNQLVPTANPIYDSKGNIIQGTYRLEIIPAIAIADQLSQAQKTVQEFTDLQTQIQALPDPLVENVS